MVSPPELVLALTDEDAEDDTDDDADPVSSLNAAIALYVAGDEPIVHWPL
jgi:hypothetical protein